MSSASIDGADRCSSVLLSASEFISKKKEIEEFYYSSVVIHHFNNQDNLDVTCAEYKPITSEGCLVVFPGRGETPHKYAEFIYSLRSLHLRILVIFGRGQGESARLLNNRQKCHLVDFKNLRDDAAFILDAFNVRNFVLLSFSMGALVALDYIFNEQNRPKKAVFIAPYIWPYFKLPAPLLIALIWFMGSVPFLKECFTPHGREYKKVPFEENYHSHCIERYEAYHAHYAQHPHETIGGPTYAFVKAATRTQLKLMHSRIDFTIPTRAFLCGDDKVVCTERAKAFFLLHASDTCPHVVSVEDHVFHDVINESDIYRTPILSEALAFLLEE